MTLFFGCGYHLASSFSPTRQSQLSLVLKSNGATESTLQDATHIITNSSQFEGSQFIAQGVSVVTDFWVDRCVHVGKIQPAQYYSPDPSMIFSGVVACATELPPSDLEVLSAGITALGGQWRTGLTREVTHLFALSSGSNKYETAMHFQAHTKVKILLPHWFDDAVRLGLGSLPTTEYEWPEPRLMKLPMEIVSADKMKLAAEKKSLYKSTMWTPGKEIPPAPLGQRDVWKGRRILLSSSLELTAGRREAVQVGIVRAMGTVVEYEKAGGDGDAEEEAKLIDEADILVTRYRSGIAYLKALRANKTIGTLSWLFHVESTGVLTRPADQLLHYPIPKKSIEGFSSHEITVTNYTGESREYLKKLITAMGAQFTPSMSGRNTVLIAAHISGTKATKARNWSIPIVNHTWLEDCFVQWRNLTVGLEKYIIFPPGMDFSQMLGERGVGKAMLDDADLELELECAREGEAEAEVRAGDKIPVGTEASAMDAKEVEGVVGLFDDEDNVLMNAAIAPTDGDSGTMQLKAKSKPKPASKLSKPDSKKKGMALEDGAMSEDIQRTPRKHASPLNGSRVQEPSESDDTRNRNDDGIGLLHVPRRGGRHMTDVSPTREGQKGQVKSRPEEEAAVAEVQGEPRSSTRKRKDPPASEDDDDLEMEVEVQPKKRAATRTKARAWTDTDDEDITRQATTVGPTAGGSKGKGKATIDATPSVTISSPANRVPTPKRVLSVLMPTLASVLSPSKPLLRAPPKGATAGPSPRNAPQRTESICVTANEASSSKRVRLAAASPSSSIRMVTPSATSTPVLAYASGKRSAATKATQRLHEVVMPDVLNYQQEMRKSSKAKGRDRATDGSRDIDVSSRSRKKRTPDVQSASSSDEEDRRRKKPRVSLGSGKRTKIAALSVEGDDSEGPFKSNKRRITSDNEEGEIHKPAHKIGKSRGDTKPIKLMTTQVTLSDDVIKALTKLGVKMTTKPAECTHLIAPHLVRTEKFLCALAVSPFILSEKWATESAAAKELLLEEEYFLQDPENEKKYDFKLLDAIGRAKQTGGGVFANKMFYVTPKVPIDMKLLKNIVIAAGGQISTQLPTARILGANGNRHVISCPADASIWRPLVQHHHPIYTQELILTGALRQHVDWEQKSFKVPQSC